MPKQSHPVPGPFLSSYLSLEGQIRALFKNDEPSRILDFELPRDSFNLKKCIIIHNMNYLFPLKAFPIQMKSRSSKVVVLTLIFAECLASALSLE